MGDGFTSPPRKACCGFFRPKNPTASAGIEPTILGNRGQHANHAMAYTFYSKTSSENLNTSEPTEGSFEHYDMSTGRNTSGSFALLLILTVPTIHEYLQCILNTIAVPSFVFRVGYYVKITTISPGSFVLPYALNLSSYLLTYLLHGAESFLRN